jgi:DNA-binding XRE family transcriptional regulator
VKKSGLSNMTFSDWQSQQYQDPAFVAESRGFELGYQLTRLRLLRGMTQAELADKVGTRQLSIARLENGSSMPSLSFLERIAAALDAEVEIKIRPRTAHP